MCATKSCLDACSGISSRRVRWCCGHACGGRGVGCVCGLVMTIMVLPRRREEVAAARTTGLAVESKRLSTSVSCF